MHSTCLSHQDTLPAEDPSWSYSEVPGPGQPAPIPRNEPVLYIPRPNHTVDHTNVHTIAMCLQNLRTVKVHFPPANSESMNDHGTVVQMTHAFSPDNSLGKVCIIACSFRMAAHADAIVPNQRTWTSFVQSHLLAWAMIPSRCRQWLR